MSFNTRSAYLLFAIAISPSLAFAAGMRHNSNRNKDEQPLPASVAAAQAGQLLEDGYLDVTRPPFNAKNDCSTDAAAAFNSALDYGHDYVYAVYVPKGCYLFESKLDMRQKGDYYWKSNRKHFKVLVGDDSGGTFPTLRLADSTPSSNLWSVQSQNQGGAVTLDIQDAFIYGNLTTEPYAPSHYMTVLRGFDIDMGDNPTAAAVAMSGAQGVTLEDINVFGTSFRVGVDELPGSGGSTTNLTVTGGQWCVEHGSYRPNPSIQGLACLDQGQGGVNLFGSRGVLVVAGFSMKSDHPGYEAFKTHKTSYTPLAGQPGGNLIVLDGTIDAPSGKGIVGESTTVTALNVFVRAETMFENGSANPPTEVVPGSATDWKRVKEYTHTAHAGGGYYFLDGVCTGCDAQEDNHFTVGVVDVSEADVPELLRAHSWDPAAFPSRFNICPAVGIVRPGEHGATPDNGVRPVNGSSPAPADDDAPALNEAAAEAAAAGKCLFLPRGYYDVEAPFEIPVGSRILGAHPSGAVIQASSKWQPGAPTALCRTADATGSVILSTFACNGLDPHVGNGLAAHKHVTVFHGRSSAMQVRALHVNKNPPGAGDYEYSDSPFVYFSGQAGGRFWNMPFDLGPGAAVQNVSSIDSGYRTIKVEGTTHPLAFYQWNSERSPAHPQTEVLNSRNVTIIGLKMEVGRDYSSSDPSALPGFLSIRGSENIVALGGSGNYHVAVNENIIEVEDSSDVLVAGLQRQDPDNSTAKCFLADGAVCAPYNNRYMSYFRKGTVSTYGELVSTTEDPVGDAGVPPADASETGGESEDGGDGNDGGGGGGDATAGEGGTTADGGALPSESGASEQGGCGCRAAGGGSPRPVAWVLLALAFGMVVRRAWLDISR